jgi:hypothetical protein
MTAGGNDMVAKPKQVRAKKYDRKVVGKAVLDGMHEGLSLRKSCAAQGIIPTTFLLWTNEDPILNEHYAKARDALHAYWADEIMSIADEPVGSTDSGATDSGAVQKQRLQIDSRKWLLSKLASKQYGDKLQVAGDADSPLMIQQITRKVVE